MVILERNSRVIALRKDVIASTVENSLNRRVRATRRRRDARETAKQSSPASTLQHLRNGSFLRREPVRADVHQGIHSKL
jgi:hypothetical protein